MLYFRSVFPAAKILAVEPDPRTFRLLDRNVGELQGVQVERAAVGARSGTGWVGRDGWSWTVRVTPDVPPGDATPVVLRRLDELCPQGVPRSSRCLLKLDVEGAEWDALGAADLSRFDIIVGELHPEQLPVVASRFFDLLGDFEVRRLDESDHGTFHAVRPSAGGRGDG